MVAKVYCGGIDGLDKVTPTNIDNTIAADSSCGHTVRVRYYTNSNYVGTIRYCQKPSYKKAKENLKHYLERKKLLKMQSGWINPPAIKNVLNIKPKHPAVFKNFAMNSKRGN
jgi:hypothetical protein